MADLERWPIIICHRRDDGAAAARRVYEALGGERVAISDATQIELDPVLDEKMLETARAFVVVCTPGACMDLRPEQKEDAVHSAIEWWLEHREAAPILIDAIGNGRWIPDPIRQQWQNLQWRRCTAEWDALDESDLRRRRAELRQWIVGSILPGASELYVKELGVEKERVRQRDRALLEANAARDGFRRAFAIATALLFVSLALCAFLVKAWSDKNRALGERVSALADKDRQLEIGELQNQLGQSFVVVSNGFAELAFTCNKVQNRNASELQFQIGREAMAVAERLASEFSSEDRDPCQILTAVAGDAERWAAMPTRGARCVDDADRAVPRLLRGIDLARSSVARARKAKLTLDMESTSAQDMERRLRDLGRLDPGPC